MAPEFIEQVVEVRKKNQITWPIEVAKGMRIQEGARLVIQYFPARGVASVRALPESYAGTLRGVYGTSAEEIQSYVRGEQEAWE